MTDAATNFGDLDKVTGADIRTVTFGTSKAFGRGYEHHEVDVFVDRCAAAVDHLREQMQGYAEEISRLRERIDRDSRSDEVAHAVSVLSTAQQTADKTVEEADRYSARVMADARDLYEDARRNAATLEQETENKARDVYQDALNRAATVEKESQDRVAKLSLVSVAAQQELETQTAYLRTLRDATRTQVETFLEGLLDHVASEYGRAHPVAAEAANATAPSRVRHNDRLAALTDNSSDLIDGATQQGVADPGIPAQSTSSVPG